MLCFDIFIPVLYHLHCLSVFNTQGNKRKGSYFSQFLEHLGDNFIIHLGLNWRLSLFTILLAFMQDFILLIRGSVFRFNKAVYLCSCQGIHNLGKYVLLPVSVKSMRKSNYQGGPAPDRFQRKVQYDLDLVELEKIYRRIPEKGKDFLPKTTGPYKPEVVPRASVGITSLCISKNHKRKSAL